MKVRTQLASFFVIALGVSIAIAAVVWQAARRSDDAQAQQQRARTAARQMASLMVLTQEYARTPEERVWQQWTEKHASMLAQLGDEAQAPDAAVAPLRESALRLITRFRTLAEAHASIRTPLGERRTALLEDQLVADTQDLTDGIFRWSREAGTRHAQAERRFQWVAAAALATLFVLFVGQALLVSTKMLRFLRRLERVTRAVERGDLSVRLGLSSRDELGRLAARFDAMASALDARERELRQEVALRQQSERRIRTITDNLPALIGYVDRGETYRFTNAHYKTVFGVEPESLLGKTVLENLGPEAAVLLRPRIDAVLRGERVKFERHDTQDGRDLHLLVDYVPDIGEDGAVDGFYILVLDITARKTAELEQARSEERVRSILTHAPDAFISIDADGRIQEWNRQAEHTFGWRRDEALGQPLAELIIPHALRPTHEAGLRAFQATGQGRVFNRRVQLPALHRDGRQIPVELSVAARTEGGSFVANAFLHDISARHAAEARILASEKLLRDITDNVPALIGYFDAELRMEFANGPARALFGVDPARDVRSYDMREALGDAVFALHAPHLPAVLAGRRVSFQGSAQVGHSQHFQAHLVPDTDADGRVRGFYIMTFDLTALKQAEQRAQEMARSDALTGLPNRRSFEERLEQALARSKRDARALALLFVDVDRFKEINDAHGHKAGDLVLRECAARLKACVRGTDTVARLAGDEFTLILEGLHSERDGVRVARKIVRAMRVPMQVEGRTVRISASVGVAVLEGREPQTESAFARLSSLSATELTARADAALYEVKRSGRDNYAVHGASAAPTSAH
jgi:diguanylate cyclase (GGDEF)-like protein/PAS domain S-box-containing protein